VKSKFDKRKCPYQTAVQIIKISRQHNKPQLKTTLLLYTLLVYTFYAVIIRCIFLRLKHIKHKTKISKNNAQSSQNIKLVESVNLVLNMFY
jgi:hypothetical protein